jgi:hypothetical protein
MALNQHSDAKAETARLLGELIDQQQAPVNAALAQLKERQTALTGQLKTAAKADRPALNKELKEVKTAINAKTKQLTGAITGGSVIDPAKASYAALQALIWPATREVDAAAEAQLVRAFQANAMKLYKPSDAKKFKRERRFSTVDAAFESASW